jgi:hypothetical protein
VNTLKNKGATIVYSVFIGTLLLLILFSIRKYIYDERIFVSNLIVIEKYGISAELFTEMRNQSPGPLYQIVHYLCKPLTRYDPRAMRILNYLFLWILIAFIHSILKFYKIDRAWPQALSIIAVPMTWAVAGMALSEIPAILFCCAAIVLFINSLQLKSALKSFGCSLAGGSCLGLSIIGRSPFLVLFIPFLLFVNRDNWKKILIFLSFGAIIPVYAFSIWHGLVPADVLRIQYGWNIWYGILGIGYLALVTILMVPNWFSASSQMIRLAAAAFIITSVLNCFFFKITYFPLHKAVLGIFGKQIVLYISYIVPGIIVTLALLFIIQGYNHYRAHRTNILFMFSFLSAVLITITSLKSSAQFSSRYIAQALPFIVLYSSFFEKTRYTLLFHSFGIVIGICSLVGYYITYGQTFF